METSKPKLQTPLTNLLKCLITLKVKLFCQLPLALSLDTTEKSDSTFFAAP